VEAEEAAQQQQLVSELQWVSESQKFQSSAVFAPASHEELQRKRPSPRAKGIQPRADALLLAPRAGAVLQSAFAMWNSVLRSSVSFLNHYSESIRHQRFPFNPLISSIELDFPKLN
jgi:hypothetical protein